MLYEVITDFDQPGDAMHQHAGLTGAGTGQHQQVFDVGGHRLALGVVQGVDSYNFV